MQDGALLPGSPFVLEPQVLAVPLAIPIHGAAEMRGALDSCTRQRINGWAYSPGSDAPIALQILDNGVPIARVLANEPRPDLPEAGIGTGRHAFDLLIPGGLSPLTRHVIDIRRDSDGARLPGAPVVIEPAGGFGARSRRRRCRGGTRTRGAGACAEFLAHSSRTPAAGSRRE